ncbi:MAG: hypothetical protein LBQ77_03170 [Treponema sp.]|jgi:hypothetical protein|nr:hypothetical protein [Treponema sp.]
MRTYLVTYAIDGWSILGASTQPLVLNEGSSRSYLGNITISTDKSISVKRLKALIAQQHGQNPDVNIIIINIIKQENCPEIILETPLLL